MGDDQVTMKVEIDPGVGTAAFRTAEQVAVEVAGLSQIPHREGEVKQRPG